MLLSGGVYGLVPRVIAGLACIVGGKQTGEDSIKPVLAIAIALHVSLYHSAVSIHLRYN